MIESARTDQAEQQVQLQFEATGTPTGRRRTRILHPAITKVMPILAVLLMWEVGEAAGVISPVFFPAPHIIVEATWSLITTGDALSGLAVTLQRIVLGFALGSIPAVFLGLLMGRLKSLRAVLEPLVDFFYTTPKIAILPLLLVIFGLGSPPIIVLAAIICFFPSVINTLYGVLQVDERLVLMARNVGATEIQILRKILLPGATPSIFAGLRLGLGAALLGTVAGEFVATSSGIGAQTWLYWQIYQIKNMYGTLVIIVVLGFLLTNGLIYAQQRLFPWATNGDKEG